MTDRFLEKAYALSDVAAARALYDDWSGTYEAEVGENGYATPARCAEALAQFAPDTSAPLLDFGCGTGLGGVALAQAGFAVIDGVDLSEKMIAQARDKNIYRRLEKIDEDAQISGDYRLMSAIGVIGPGAAPVSALDTLLHALPSDGLLVFSFNDHALADSSNTGRLNEWLDCGAARLLFMEHGAHFPEMDMNATVYVVQKA